MKTIILMLTSLLLLSGCEKTQAPSSLDLNQIQKEFIHTIGKEGVEESPFQWNYTLRTVFFSSQIISLFGTVQTYDSPPSPGWRKYEGKTMCKIGGQFRDVGLSDLFPTKEHQEFLRIYCESHLKYQPLSYFAGKRPLREHLDYEEIAGFVVDRAGLIFFFRDHSVGKGSDLPFVVRIPYEYLQGKWNVLHPFASLIEQALFSQSYTASWDKLMRDGKLL